MRVAFFPQWRKNPYLELLAAGLEENSVFPCWDIPHDPNISWLLRSGRSIDVLHFHWPETYYEKASFASACIGVIRFLSQILVARFTGYRLAWTVHNIYPHVRRYPLLDFLVWHSLALFSHTVFVHCENTRAVVANKFRRKKEVYVIHHGNYNGVYGNPIEQAVARAQLGISEEKIVVLFLGHVKAYKGLESLLHAFSQVASERLMLLIAGRPHPENYGTQVLKLAENDSRARCILRWITNEEVPLFIGACDAMALPFSRIQTSGSLVLAMSYGRTVIAPRMGCIPETVNDSAALLYDPNCSDGLRHGIERTLTADLKAMGWQSGKFAEAWNWNEIAATTKQAYEKALFE